MAATALLTIPCMTWAGERGQEKSDFAMLDTKLRAGDPVTVTMRDGTTVKGRVVKLLDTELVVVADGVQREIAADRIQRIQRRRNGVTLGALIGAGAAVPFAIAVAQPLGNEGADATLPALLTIVGGIGAGAGIDALLVRPRTVFDRKRETAARLSVVIDRQRVMATMRIAF